MVRVDTVETSAAGKRSYSDDCSRCAFYKAAIGCLDYMLDSEEMSHHEYNSKMSGLYHAATEDSLKSVLASKMVEKNTGLIIDIAVRKLRKKPEIYSGVITLWDVVDQTAYKLLKSGVKSYDPSKGNFSAYLNRLVSQSVKELYLQSLHILQIPDNVIEDMRIIDSFLKKYHADVDVASLPFRPDVVKEIQAKEKIGKSRITKAADIPDKLTVTDKNRRRVELMSWSGSRFTGKEAETYGRMAMEHAIMGLEADGILTPQEVLVIDGGFGMGYGRYIQNDGRGIEHDGVEMASRLRVRPQRVNFVKKTALAKLRESEKIRELAGLSGQ